MTDRLDDADPPRASPDPARKTIRINGRDIDDIPSFYDEINRVFMADEAWTLAPSLDAFDDMLYGSYGAIDGREPIIIAWQAIDHSEAALGRAATRDFLRGKLAHPNVFNTALITSQLAALEDGSGKTYFEIVIDIIAAHDNIELVSE